MTLGEMVVEAASRAAAARPGKGRPLTEAEIEDLQEWDP
jgi:hypothetical protein